MNDEYYENIRVALKAKIRIARALGDSERQQSFERTLKEFEQQMLEDCEYVKEDPVDYIRSCKL